MMVSLETFQGSIALLMELSRGAAGIRVASEFGDPPPIDIQNPQIVHFPSTHIQTSAKELALLGAVELAFHIRGYGAGKSFDIHLIQILDTETSPAAANGLP